MTSSQLPTPAAIATKLVAVREPKPDVHVEVVCKDCGDKFQVSVTWLSTENPTELHCGWCNV